MISQNGFVSLLRDRQALGTREPHLDVLLEHHVYRVMRILVFRKERSLHGLLVRVERSGRDTLTVEPVVPRVPTVSFDDVRHVYSFPMTRTAGTSSSAHISYISL